MNISIVYETPDFLVINKPSGLLTHPVNRQDKSESVAGWLLENYPEVAEIKDEHSASFGEWVDLRPGIVHRLDRETSGLMLLAKTEFGFKYLKTLFQERKIKKTYLALVHGRLKNKSGRIETSIGKLGTRQTTKVMGRHRLKEKPAVTGYNVVNEYADYSLLEAQPETGRTHQIRIHLKSIGHPIVCDPIYGSKQAVCPPELGRLFLHAQKLSFVSPSGAAIAVEADLPPELEKFLEKLQKSSK